MCRGWGPRLGRLQGWVRRGGRRSVCNGKWLRRSRRARGSLPAPRWLTGRQDFCSVGLNVGPGPLLIGVQSRGLCPLPGPDRGCGKADPALVLGGPALGGGPGLCSPQPFPAPRWPESSELGLRPFLGVPCQVSGYGLAPGLRANPGFRPQGSSFEHPPPPSSRPSDLWEACPSRSGEGMCVLSQSFRTNSSLQAFCSSGTWSSGLGERGPLSGL